MISVAIGSATAETVIVTHLDTSVPPQWLEAAAGVRLIAATVADPPAASPPWQDGSIAARELLEEPRYGPLPFEHPVATTLVHPLMSIGQARDHLMATAGVLESKETVLAQLTLLRPILVGLGLAFYIAEPGVGVHERVRRAMNVELDSATEVMRFLGKGADRFDYYDGRRRSILGAARPLWSSVTSPEPRTGSSQVKDWWIGDKPPTEMGIVRGILSSVHSSDIADGVYRLLSAPTHAQPHALLNVIQAGQAVHDPAGFATAPIGISFRQVLTWLLSAGMACSAAHRRCCELYGWSVANWNERAYPQLAEWNRLLNG